jgi:hypothetical protein
MRTPLPPVSMIGLAVLMLAAPSVWSGESRIVMVLAPGQIPVTAKLDVPAVYAIAPLSVDCDEREASKRASQLAAATRRIAELGRSGHGVEVRQGVITLDTAARESFAYSKSYGSGGGSSVLFVVSRLGDTEDIYSAAIRLAQFASAIPKLECVSVRAGHAVLGLDDPERFRPQVLKLVAAHIKDAKVALGPSREIEVSGLERPVVAMQKNGREVTLFIHYTLTVRQ